MNQNTTSAVMAAGATHHPAGSARDVARWLQPLSHSQTVVAPQPEPTAEVADILIDAWARHAMASSGFGG